MLTLVPDPASEPSAPKLLEDLVRQAEQAGASDIHLHRVGQTAEIAFRLDGVLAPIATLPASVADRVFGRVKYLARLKTYQEALPQDGRIDRDQIGTRNDIRVSTYPTVTGEKLVLRLFQETPIQNLADLGLEAEAVTQLELFLRRFSGLMLLTGPAGSGKTTTIHACLRHLTAPAQGRRHIITIEDPVEQIIPGVMQTEVNEARGLTFAQAAKHLLRQDPEVLVVGEIRDEETAQLTVRAALTGHLVFATLHAGSCRTVLERLLAFCPDSGAALPALELLFNQRLLRRCCSNCRGKGCAGCLGTGYRGRIVAAEWFRLNDARREAIRTQGAGVIQSAPTLAEAAQVLVQKGVTDEAEYRRLFDA